MGVDQFLSKFGGKVLDETAEELEQPISGGLDVFLNKFGPKLSESYWFYQDTLELRFDKEAWTYYLVGELGELTPQYGVTSVIKIIDKSAMLVPWAAKMAIEKLLRTVPVQVISTGLDDLSPLSMVPAMSLADFTRLALEAKAAHKERLEDAGTVGHQAHQFLEEWIKAGLSGKMEEQDKMLKSVIQLTDERAVNCVKAALKWVKTHSVRWLHTEKKIYSRTNKYAGTMDGLAKFSSCQDRSCCAEQFSDQLVLVDFKTSNALRLEYILQVSAYKNAYQEEHGTLIEHGVVLRLGKEDGQFESLPLNAEDFSDGFAGFLACLELFKDVEKIEETWKTKKEYRKKAQKEVREEAREAAKAAEKADKAAAKAEARIAKEEEVKRIKAEAKVERERLREEARNAKVSKVNAGRKAKAAVVPVESNAGGEAVPEPVPSIPSAIEAPKINACVPMEEAVILRVEIPTEGA
jgi:hypothetical protein